MKTFTHFPTADAGNPTNQLSFRIHTIDWMEKHSELENAIAIPSGKFMLMWVISGNGSYYLNHQQQEISDSKLLLIQPGSFNELQLTGKLQGYIILFDKDFLSTNDNDTEFALSTLHQMFGYTRLIDIDEETAEDIKGITAMMVKEFDNHNLYRAQILRKYFKIFLIYLSRQFEVVLQPFRQSRNAELVQNFMGLLEKNFRAYKMVSDYADQLSVTPNYLNEVVKKITGHSAGHHIRQRVAMEAKRQAACSNNCMKEIAYDLGFFDMSHFSKFFKNTTGINFSDFKKNEQVLQTALRVA